MVSTPNPVKTSALLIQTGSAHLTVVLPASMQMSSEQFYEFCRTNRELRIERAATGEVMIMSPTQSDTGNRNFNLVGQVAVWAEQNGSGFGFDSSTGFTLPNGATRSPDVAWVRGDRWNALTDEEKASFAPICPDFVVELRSANDTLKGLQDKMQEYLANGASLGLLIDRKNRNVYVYRSKQEAVVLENPEAVSGEPDLPGFVLRMANIW